MKHIEQVEIYDPKVRTRRVAELHFEGPQTIIDALEEGCVSWDLLANATYGSPGDKITITAKVVFKDRNGKPRRR